MLLRSLRQFRNYWFAPHKELARPLRDILGFTPAYLPYYKQAFTPKGNNSKTSETHNERLEFLGDAVLGSVIAEYLYKKYPFRDEGFMTMMRSRMVNRKTLGELGKRMELDDFMGSYPDTMSDSILGNAFESFIGAVYLDMGYEATRRFILRRLVKEYYDVNFLETHNSNYKSQLLEYCQKNHKPLRFEVLEQVKHNRRDRFKVGAFVSDKLCGTGEDYNKKSAEQTASEKALRSLGLIKEKEEDM